MIATRHPVHYSFRDYVLFEAASNVKHEYLAGQIYAMAGGTPEHALLSSNVNGQLYAQLRGTQCAAHTSDLRVRVVETGLATYPDVTVVCGPWEHDAEDKNTVINPTVIVEVLSLSTAAYDCGEKFEHYQRIQSLEAYVIVSGERQEIEVWTRGDGWGRAVSRPGEMAEIGAIGCKLDVFAVFEDANARRG